MTDAGEPNRDTEKRIGRRVPTPDFPVSIIVTSTVRRRLGDPSSWFAKTEVTRVDGEMLDVSVTGIRVATSRDVDLPLGTVVELEVGKVVVSAVVRRRDDGGEEVAAYGFELIDLREPLRSEFYGQVFTARPDLEELWKRAW